MSSQTFPVPVANAKETGEIEYHPKSPKLEYHQNNSNSCYFSSLATKLISPGENNAARAIAIQIQESLCFVSKGYKDIIEFDSYQMRNQYVQHLHYKVNKWKNRAVMELFLIPLKTLPW